MKHTQFGKSRPESRRCLGFTVLVLLAVGLAMQSMAHSEPQPPTGTLSEGYRDPNIRREYMFPESHGYGINRRSDRNGFSWEFHLSTFVPQEYVASGTPRLYKAEVYTSGAVPDATGQTIQLRGRGGLLVAKGKIRTTDRFRIRYRHDFIEPGQRFYSVVTADLTYFGEFTDSTLGEIQVFLSTKPDIPEDFLNRLEQKHALRQSGQMDGSVIVTIMQPDSIDGVPLPPDSIPEPVETVTFTDLVQEAKLFRRNKYSPIPPELDEAQIFILGQPTRVSGQFWDDNKPATVSSVGLLRNKVPGLIRVVLLANRQGRLLDVSKPRGPNNPNSNPFLAENAFLTELKIVGPLKTLTLTGRYRDDGKGQIIIPPTEATLSFIDSLKLFDRVDAFLTFALDAKQ